MRKRPGGRGDDRTEAGLSDGRPGLRLAAAAGRRGRRARAFRHANGRRRADLD